METVLLLYFVRIAFENAALGALRSARAAGDAVIGDNEPLAARLNSAERQALPINGAHPQVEEFELTFLESERLQNKFVDRKSVV